MHFFFNNPKKNRGGASLSIFFVFLFPLVFPFNVLAEESAGGDALMRLLPPESELRGWKLDDPPQTAEGRDLFLLINGGAGVYLQEGFKRAILASYSDGKGKMINVEIFEMSSPESAGNIHKKKIGKQGRKVPISEEAVLEDYYLNFRQGRFQGTLSGYDSEEETVKMLLYMARLLAEKIQSLL